MLSFVRLPDMKNSSVCRVANPTKGGDRCDRMGLGFMLDGVKMMQIELAHRATSSDQRDFLKF
jgi:hypothetical protein